MTSSDDTQNDTSELELEQILLDYLSWAYEIGLKDGTGLAEVRKEATEELLALIAQREQAAELRGMGKAKNRVLRRTEIPADAKNPTRDATVYLGEEIADIIQRDMDELQATKPEKGTEE